MAASAAIPGGGAGGRAAGPAGGREAGRGEGPGARGREGWGTQVCPGRGRGLYGRGGSLFRLRAACPVLAMGQANRISRPCSQPHS